MSGKKDNALSRRALLRGGLGILGAAFVSACTRALRPQATSSTSTATTPSTSPTTTTSLPSCIVVPAETEGPYFVDEMLNRSDIRVDPSDGSTRSGVQLRLIVNVSRVSGSSCAALTGAHVDVWHCDAEGVYSDVQASVGKKFLRGYQVTDRNGRVEFVTIYPGWYMGRATHIHFKIRTFSGSSKTFEFTSQFFFDDSLTDQVYSKAPYSAKGARDTRNANDMVFNSPSANAGSQLLLAPAKEGSGYRATFNIGLQMG